jgi:hypothetical protein
MNDCRVYRSDTIVRYQNEMIEILDRSVSQKEFSEGYTWAYGKYNVFGLTSATIPFYDLFVDLRNVIFDFVQTDQRMWIQSWVNYHTIDEVLDWHDHGYPYHGYISIRPHKTRTEFEEYEIRNQIGDIYIGPGYRKHRVVVDEEFDTPRITIGFDVLTEDQIGLNNNLGMVPLLR